LLIYITVIKPEELNDLYCSPNIFRVIKSRRFKWLGRVARIRKRRGITEFWWGNLRKRDHLEEPDVDRRIILRLIFRKWDEGVWTESSWLRIERGSGYL
jgi:hypothetical protein